MPSTFISCRMVLGTAFLTPCNKTLHAFCLIQYDKPLHGRWTQPPHTAQDRSRTGHHSSCTTAWLGTAQKGQTQQIAYSICIAALLSTTCTGQHTYSMAWHGMARHSTARHGTGLLTRWLTAFMKRACSSEVHTKRGFLATLLSPALSELSSPLISLQAHQTLMNKIKKETACSSSCVGACTETTETTACVSCMPALRLPACMSCMP